MDLKMDAEKITNIEHPIWDVKIENGIVPILSGEAENVQAATMAVFLQRSSIPQAKDVGIPWTDFLTHKRTFGEIDGIIRQSMTDARQSGYVPDYGLENDKLTITVGKA